MNEFRLPNGDSTCSDNEVLECLFNTHFPGCVDIMNLLYFSVVVILWVLLGVS